MRALGLAAALALAVAAVYAPVANHGFLNLDDNEYVTDNRYVRTGLSAENVTWALTAFHSGHWHPLTWLSLMLDCHWSGTNAGALHVVNVLLHVAAVVLLFLWVRSATGCFWRSALVAALFAMHPLRVESVAWVAARKDMLSGALLMLTLWSYVTYAKQPSLLRYVAVFLSYGLALLAKPTVAIVPFGLLLLDFWPLRRISGVSPLQATRQKPDGQHTDVPAPRAPAIPPATLLLEKLPLLALAALTLTQTWSAQHAAGAVAGEYLPLAARAGNALWNYALYLGATFWPFRLAVFYPLRPVPAWQSLSAALLLAIVTLVVWRLRNTRPYLLAGWLWFAGTLVPVSGIIQFGGQSMADRYAYIPHIGLLLAIVWAAADAWQRLALPKRAAAVAAVVLLVALAARSRDQLAHWRDTITLFEHAIEVTDANYMAHNNLGVALEAAGRREEAARHYEQAVRFNPTWPEALNNLGIAHAWKGDYAGARRHFAEALRVRPRFARAENNMGTAYGREGNYEAAIPHYARAVEIDREYFDARYALADALERRGRLAEAAEHYRVVLELRPGFPPAAAALERLRGK